MRASITARRIGRRSLSTIVAARQYGRTHVVFSGHREVATAQVTVGPSVPAAGVGTAAARNSPNCGPDGNLAYPSSFRPPCTRPLEKGESNGGATTMGVTAETIKIVLLLSSTELQERLPAVGRPNDRATGAPGYENEAYRDWEAVLAHSFNTWGRTFEFGVVNQTGTDEAAQHADALDAAEQKPFAVISGSGVPVPVFASDLVAKKIIVFQGGVNNAEAARQEPYRWGSDSDGPAVNGAQFAARKLRGETAKWSGDFTTRKRVFGALHPSRGIDWQRFERTAKTEGLDVVQTVEYSVPIDLGKATTQYQEDAPVMVAKLKDAGVTTVLLYAYWVMVQDVFKAADDLDYHPEWVFPGFLDNDVEYTARLINTTSPDQMRHVFGFGNSPPYVAGIENPVVTWFNWYWGKNEGVYSVSPIGALATLHQGVSLAGPRLTPARFRQGLFSMPAGGGAASNGVESYMGGFGRTTGVPYDDYSIGNRDFAVIWWSPTEVGKGKYLNDDGTGRFMYVDGAKRYHAGQWTKGEPELFDPSNSISQFDGLPASDVLPDFACEGCPSATR